MKPKVNIFWFRRDLRLEDNTALYAAGKNNLPILPVFIFDKSILSKLDSPFDRRVHYIHQALSSIHNKLKDSGSSICSFFDYPVNAFKTLIDKYDIAAVYCNRDYEPAAIERDQQIADLLHSYQIPFFSFKDQVIFEKDEILKSNGEPYSVFTPYANCWISELNHKRFAELNVNIENFFKASFPNLPTLATLGFQNTDMVFRKPEINISIVKDYDRFRNFPAMNNTSQLGIAFRFGTISIRKAVNAALKYNAVWLNELIWREFFMQILYHFPQVEHSCFKPAYENIQWRNDEKEFELWTEGKTGYPIVDAGMRELNTTGFIHNRVRMITAGFLCKHLLIDWRWGEAYFASKLNDYELSSNNGNWQWSAGCGCDAAPYFRIFNPLIQAEKFDKEKIYIRKWITEAEENTLPQIIEHRFARERALQVYKAALRDK